ncbi:NUDIX domain-containing protein [Rhodovibrionaceae bacterium A322]
MTISSSAKSSFQATPFTENDVEIQSREVVFQGFFRMAQYDIRHRLFSGGWSNSLNREVLERNDCIALLPYDPHLDRIVLIEQFRLAAHLAGGPAWQLEIVAGIIDQEATAQEIALKETKEETGLAVQNIDRICRYMPSAGGCLESIDLFVGQVDCRDVAEFHGVPEEGEDIRAVTLSTDEAFDLIDRGQIQHSAALIALLWLKNERDALREKWR